MSIQKGRNGKLQHNRQHEIYLLALKNGAVDVSNLAEHFEVTTETIRRDLSELQDRKVLRRVHGGAVPIERVNFEPMVATRDMLNADEKLRIAQVAIAEVPTNGSVIIDSGSTGQRLAEVFPLDRNVHVVTNSLVTALTLSRRGIQQITVLGGGVRTNTFAMTDSTAVAALRSIAVDVLFISCDGLSFLRGLTTPYQEESAIKRTMIESARRVVAIVDHSKFGNGQMFSYAALDEIDVLVTDSNVDDDTMDVLSEHGIDVRRA